jgi:hypothetical protein
MVINLLGYYEPIFIAVALMPAQGGEDLQLQSAQYMGSRLWKRWSGAMSDITSNDLYGKSERSLLTVRATSW